MSLNHAANAGRASLGDRKDDLYETPPEAVRALLAVEKIPAGAIWEPACGPGAIVRVLKEAGHRVYATDLVDYESPDQDAARIDFLMEQQAPDFHIGAIITNPPFKLAERFVGHALLFAPVVMMLMRLAFLEGGNMNTPVSRIRREILDGGQLARVYLFRNRLPMMHRGGWAGRQMGSSIPFAWFVWDREHRGPTELHRISWS
jgi:hypothetical protein